VGKWINKKGGGNQPGQITPAVSAYKKQKKLNDKKEIGCTQPNNGMRERDKEV